MLYGIKNAGKLRIRDRSVFTVCHGRIDAVLSEESAKWTCRNVFFRGNRGCKSDPNKTMKAVTERRKRSKRKRGKTMECTVRKDYQDSAFFHQRNENPDLTQFGWHCHAFYELLYVVQGNGKVLIEGTEYPMRAGSVYFMRPHEFHHAIPDPDGAYERYVINFKSAAVKESLLRLSVLQNGGKYKNGVFFPPGSVTDEMLQSFAEMDRVCTALFAEAKHRDSKEETYLMALLTKIILLLSLENADTTGSQEENLISNVMEYLGAHLNEDISLDELAVRFFVSKYYLCRAFRKYTGVSVFGYLNAKRIALAQTLLSNGESATSVAYRVGFRNYSSFYRTYCKLTGNPPVYRQLSAKETVEKSDI